MMNRRSYCLAAGIVFIVIALLSLLRILYGWNVVIGGGAVPEWMSWILLIVAGYLGFEGLRLARSGWLLP